MAYGCDTYGVSLATDRSPIINNEFKRDYLKEKLKT